jgi:RHS repeat-associated protein
VLEYDGASGAILRWYAYGLGSNEVLNQTNVVAGTRAALIPDIQGSVIASVDSVSGTFSKIGYLPYGKSASAPGSFGYTGQRIDPETNGLYYYRARHYSPAWGRFLQTDPIGYGGGANLYAYVGNDPLNGTDPLGLYTFQIGLAGSGNILGFAVPVGLGIAMDTSGHIGFYRYAGGGVQLGADVEAGVSIQVSNAKTISDLTGGFLNASAHGGVGLGGSVDYFRGPSANGQVSGVGVTAGAALGASVSGAYTYTSLYAPWGDGSTPAQPPTVPSSGTSTSQVDAPSIPSEASLADSTQSSPSVSPKPGK